MKLLAIIPARGGSKGVPNKNIKSLGGKPLLWYTFESARISGLFNEIVLSTDSEEIAEIGKSIGLHVPFPRPAEFSSDQSKSIDVVNHCLEELEKRELNYDAVFLLQPTSPFREPNSLLKALNILETKNADSLVSVRRVPHHFNPHWLFEADENNLLKIATGETELISRRQDLPDAFYRDGQIYLTKVDVLRKQKSFTGKRLSYILNESVGSSINIDTMDDWYEAERYIANNKVEL